MASALPPSPEPGDVPSQLELPFDSLGLDKIATLELIQRTAKPEALPASGDPKEAEDAKSVLGLRFEMPLSGAGPQEWKVGAEALRSHDRELSDAATALKFSLDGTWHRMAIVAEMEQVDGDFEDPEAGKRAAGRRARFGLSRQADDWHVNATAKLAQIGAAAGKGGSSSAQTDYRVDAGRLLPGNFRSTLNLQVATDPNRDSTNLTLALRRRFDAVDVGVEHRAARVERAGRLSASQRTGLEVRLGVGAWSWIGGTSIEERDPANGGVTEIERWFLAPQWKAADNQLQLNLRLGLDREVPPGQGETQRLLGKGSLIWKLRDDQHDADLRFDLSLSHLDHASQASVLDRRAALKLSYRFWS